MNILFVCTGNICRSPLAEGILKSKFAKKRLCGIIDSCGFESFHLGDLPDPRAQKIARANGIEIGQHAARLFSMEDFDRFDKIYVMDAYHYQSVMQHARNDQDRKKVDFVMNTLYPGKNLPVKDPYFEHYPAFEIAYHQLDQACDRIAEKIAINEKS